MRPLIGFAVMSVARFSSGGSGGAVLTGQWACLIDVASTRAYRYPRSGWRNARHL
jgi:hypothetical protein